MGTTKQRSVITIGLDNSGKSTIINNLLKDPKLDITPTLGIITEHFDFKNIKFTVFDCSGYTKYDTVKQEKYSNIDVLCSVRLSSL